MSSITVAIAWVLGLILLITVVVWYCTAMPGDGAGRGLSASSTAPERVERLVASVQFLAGEIGPRNVDHPGSLDRAADWISRQLEATGLDVEAFTFLTGSTPCRNLQATLSGSRPECGSIILGAHYDTAFSAPGANDNATGVATLLELARHFAGSGALPRTLRFVAFPNEEPPYFQTERMGSRVYARLLKDRGESVQAMLSLESLGCFRDEPGSQLYPPLINLCYPDRGNFVAFVGRLSGRQLIRRATGAFRRTAALPSEGGALPGGLPGVGWSDHWAFWQEGFPALMVTDTAVFRDPNYHTPGDRPEHVDFERLALVVSGLIPVIEDLAQE